MCCALRSSCGAQRHHAPAPVDPTKDADHLVGVLSVGDVRARHPPLPSGESARPATRGSRARTVVGTRGGWAASSARNLLPDPAELPDAGVAVGEGEVAGGERHRRVACRVRAHGARGRGGGGDQEVGVGRDELRELPSGPLGASSNPAERTNRPRVSLTANCAVQLLPAPSTLISCTRLMCRRAGSGPLWRTIAAAAGESVGSRKPGSRLAR